MTKAKTLNLALQGGGAHGAFTWGVLDYLLEDERIEIAAITGTSAGAMNAVLAADGLVRGGRDMAREKLASFWKATSDAARASPLQRSPLDVLFGRWSLDHSPGYAWFDVMTRFFAPGQFNPLRLNPLREILIKYVDFDNVCHCDQMKVFVAATNVETGRVKIFDRKQLTADMVMASACLPFLFEAVEIDGIPYWDGGYSGNPPLFPLYSGSPCSDIAIVQINPIESSGAPRTAQAILNRMNEITFNASLLKELRALDFVKRLLDQGALDSQSYRDMNVHIIECQEELKPLGSSSKLNAEWAFLGHLHELGRNTSAEWLDRNFEQIGKGSTVDLRAMFQGIEHHG
ncbi:patatin-like phospholipase family protein [Salinisphaera sp. P385]|uniref:Patatin-like phospholipase family protein n=1 Tax=Spectribacter acetivorans TaxID=3075603 RepID=A0ABU3B9A5_9GAMM|nr:patatin-like phospholipase family protein [Salinisphaera sp. P385]MDT0618605.1 patatin-like phospholipase family protein [Salinisphaera sp. P385]